jgi:valyl-tRNA synthetase
MVNVPEKYQGMEVLEARKAVLKDLEDSGKLLKKKKLNHAVGTCYRCGRLIEPLVMPQWYVKIQPLADQAMEKVNNKEVEFVPKRFEKLYFNWMEKIRDWNISRQIVWGPRIPAWYCLECNPEIVVTYINQDQEQITEKAEDIETSFKEVAAGLQSLIAPVDAKYHLEEIDQCPNCGSNKVLQETDTFDTWFSSGQWPITSLRFPDSDDYQRFYPTSVLDTMWDILFFWVARMIMLCTYRTGAVPFKVAHMHSRVVDAKGQKMSKSKGNVINPMEMVEEYGADALRMALVYGVAPASDVALGRKKIESMRNFANKIWNAARFLTFYLPKGMEYQPQLKELGHQDDQWIVEELNKTIKEVNSDMEKYRFGQALEKIYQFVWHDYCDQYIEKVKDRKEEAMPVLLSVLVTSLKMLHPFAPFVSEEIYQVLKDEMQVKGLKKSLMIEEWPGN